MVLCGRYACVAPEHLPEIRIPDMQFCCQLFHVYARIQVFPEVKAGFPDGALNGFSGKFLISNHRKNLAQNQDCIG